MPVPIESIPLLRPAAAASGLLLLWLLEARIGTPRRQPEVSWFRHAARNLSLAGINATLMPVTAAAITAATIEWASSNQLGLLNWCILSPAIELLTGVLLMDVWTWFWHRTCHQLPFLWRFHRVHHSDPDMDVTTAFRFHPGELLLSAFARLPVICLLGLAAWHLLVYETLLLAASQFHHAALPAGRWDEFLRRWIVTPAIHRIHHARELPFTNSNYSSLLSCWDKLFGTWQNPLETAPNSTTHTGPKPPSCGLNGMDSETWQTLPGMTLTPCLGVQKSTSIQPPAP